MRQDQESEVQAFHQSFVLHSSASEAEVFASTFSLGATRLSVIGSFIGFSSDVYSAGAGLFAKNVK